MRFTNGNPERLALSVSLLSVPIAIFLASGVAAAFFSVVFDSDET
jgi:hypothetical protein